MRRRWAQAEWIDKFGCTVIAGFVTAIVTLASCSTIGHDDQELPAVPLASFTTTTTVPPVTVLDCGPSVPPDDCRRAAASDTASDDVRGSTGP